MMGSRRYWTIWTRATKISSHEPREPRGQSHPTLQPTLRVLQRLAHGAGSDHEFRRHGPLDCESAPRSHSSTGRDLLARRRADGVADQLVPEGTGRAIALPPTRTIDPEQHPVEWHTAQLTMGALPPREPVHREHQRRWAEGGSRSVPG